MLKNLGCARTFAWLGEFGGRSAKAVKLFGNHAFVLLLKRPGHKVKGGSPRRRLRRGRYGKSGLVISYVDKRGKQRYKASKLLRASQEYPMGFAKEDARLKPDNCGMKGLPSRKRPAMYYSVHCKPQVRDLWQRYAWSQTGIPKQGLQDIKTNHRPDLWTDARLEEVFCWLEQYLNTRRSNGKVRRQSIDRV